MLRFLTAGESHGPCLTVILEGMPAGLALAAEDLSPDLSRRQQGFGAGGRMKIEKDQVTISAGIMAGQTTGAPIALSIENRDWASWADKEIAPMTVPRPGHADLTGAIKFGYRDLRLALERASARETAARVAAGAVCKQLLTEFDITVGSFVVSIGQVDSVVPDRPYPELFALAEQSEVRCPDPIASAAMVEAIGAAITRRDTLGGVMEIVAVGVPPGLGSHVHWDRKLEARLAGAVMSIHSVKGVEIGPAFENARWYGTEVHDEIFLNLKSEDGKGSALIRHTNRAGGLEGGITNGEPVLIRAAMKPISTTLKPLRSVDLATGQPATIQYERSDFCAVPRACVVGEAMVAFILADAIIEKLGGDSLAEMRPRFASLRRSQLEDLPMDNRPWHFGFNKL